MIRCRRGRMDNGLGFMSHGPRRLALASLYKGCDSTSLMHALNLEQNGFYSGRISRIWFKFLYDYMRWFSEHKFLFVVFVWKKMWADDEWKIELLIWYPWSLSKSSFLKLMLTCCSFCLSSFCYLVFFCNLQFPILTYYFSVFKFGYFWKNFSFNTKSMMASLLMLIALLLIFFCWLCFGESSSFQNFNIVTGVLILKGLSLD